MLNRSRTAPNIKLHTHSTLAPRRNARDRFSHAVPASWAVASQCGSSLLPIGKDRLDLCRQTGLQQMAGLMPGVGFQGQLQRLSLRARLRQTTEDKDVRWISRSAANSFLLVVVLFVLVFFLPLHPRRPQSPVTTSSFASPGKCGSCPSAPAFRRSDKTSGSSRANSSCCSSVSFTLPTQFFCAASVAKNLPAHTKSAGPHVRALPQPLQS